MAFSNSYSICFEHPAFHFFAKHAILYNDEKGKLQNEHYHFHCFRASLKIEGPLNSKRCVAPFVPVRELFFAVLGDWNEKLILPIRLKARNDRENQGKKFVKASNATTEEIAKSILEEFIPLLWDEQIMTEEFRYDYEYTLRLEEDPGCFVEVKTREINEISPEETGLSFDNSVN